ncbi:hypothetical protein HID58_026544 [Brassica napus]|uniref:Uncharacterized protein n=1 Tax=Brassica napus TaxID=3708 RepID=A0ABQ8CP92_BRANA|nr:hypothetical protein HID58_026544 [Brassica napus]
MSPLTSSPILSKSSPVLASFTNSSTVLSQSPDLTNTTSTSAQAHAFTSNQETSMEAPAKFVPTLGAWAKALHCKPPATPPKSSTPKDYDPAITLSPPELKADGKHRFPWVPRLSPQSRNLYCAATPTYRLDGRLKYLFLQCTCSPAGTDTRVAQNLSNNLDKESSLVHSQQPNVTTFQDNTLITSEDTSSEILSPSTSHSQKVKHATPSHSQHEKPTPLPMSVNTFSPLVDSQFTPIDTHITGSFPSTIINNEVTITSEVGSLNTTPINCAFESLSHVGEVGIEPSNLFNFTRDGRKSKPPIKYQSMKWKTVHGKGKHGHHVGGASH